MNILTKTIVAVACMMSSVAFCGTLDLLDLEDCEKCGEPIDFLPVFDDDGDVDFEPLPVVDDPVGALTELLTGLKKPKTSNAVVIDDSSVIGTANVKLGSIKKASLSTKITVKVSLFTGKSYSATSTAYFDDDSGYYIAEGSLKFKRSPFGTLYYYLVYSSDYGVIFEASSSDGSVYVYSGSFTIGGSIGANELSFAVNADYEPDFGDGWEPVVGFPDGEPVYVKNGKKFAFNKAPTIKYKKYREDGETWYELVGLDDEKKTNVSALKLTYNAKTGIFKGSFKVYVTNECCTSGTPKLKKYTAKVTGCMIEGEGYGSAVLKVGKTQYVYPVEIH